MRRQNGPPWGLGPGGAGWQFVEEKRRGPAKISKQQHGGGGGERVKIRRKKKQHPRDKTFHSLLQN